MQRHLGSNGIAGYVTIVISVQSWGTLTAILQADPSPLCGLIKIVKINTMIDCRRFSLVFFWDEIN